MRNTLPQLQERSRGTSDTGHSVATRCIRRKRGPSVPSTFTLVSFRDKEQKRAKNVFFCTHAPSYALHTAAHRVVAAFPPARERPGRICAKTRRLVDGAEKRVESASAQSRFIGTLPPASSISAYSLCTRLFTQDLSLCTVVTKKRLLYQPCWGSPSRGFDLKKGISALRP